MNKIQILKDEIINKIAAGEVVERPASLVKELIENSIDAGASQVTISLEEGGKKSLSIFDNGHGIRKDQLPLSVLRHATSKIEEISDLFSVGTMGFRGEALASISAVSRFTLISKAKDSEQAYKLSFTDGSSVPKIDEWSHPQGTTIVVKDLFYNVPVRLKFLRSAQTEFSHVLEAIQTLALANPHISFLVNHNGKEKFSTGGVSQAAERRTEKGFWGEETLRKKIASLYDLSICEKLIYLQNSSEYGNFEALISPPGFEKASSKSMYSFVNGRWVKDKVIRYGILRGYHSHLLKGRYPLVLCYLSTSPELVDVNVHPAKTELRFQYTEEVQGLIARSIRERLRKEDWARETPVVSTVKDEVTRPVFSSPSPSYSQPPRSFTSKSFSQVSAPKRDLVFSSPRYTKPTSSYTAPIEPTVEPMDTPSVSEEPTAPQGLWLDLENAVYRGSVFKCYLIFELEDRALFIDQHALHERILYEKLCNDRTLLQMTQPLMIPEVLSFEPTLVARLLDKQETLSKSGFTYEKISEEEIEVSVIPSLLVQKDLRKVFLELASEHALKEPEEFHHLLLATIACHSAVRAGEELTVDKINQLKEECKGVDFSANCPHGRRVFKWLNKNEIEKWFDRI